MGRKQMPRTTFYGHINAQVTIQPNIGLDADARQSVIELLNLILADESMLLLKTQPGDGQAGPSGNPDLHMLYETQTEQIREVIREITERVEILGGASVHRAEQFSDD